MARPARSLGALAALAAAAVAALVAAPAATAACRCLGPPSMLGSYFKDSITAVIIATPQRILPSSDTSRRTYGLLGGPYPTNTTWYKGCPRKLERFSVFGPGTSCATTFTLGEPVLLFLSDRDFVGPCDYTVPVSALTAGDLAFLARRAPCRDTCVAGNGVHCFTAPCLVSRPCGPAGRCVDNYCGGCHAEWYTPEGKPLVCPGGNGGWGGWFPAVSVAPPTRRPTRTFPPRPTRLPNGWGEERV